MTKTISINTAERHGIEIIDLSAFMTDEEVKAHAAAMAEIDWCECEFYTTPDGPYPNNPPVLQEDGACTCGIEKHHWHCGDCGKIAQIG